MCVFTALLKWLLKKKTMKIFLQAICEFHLDIHELIALFLSTDEKTKLNILLGNEFKQ